MPNFNEQVKTLEDTKRLLAEYHKAIILRPTGFGKTWILTELIRSNYKRVLYLYPQKIVGDTVRNYHNDLERKKIETEFNNENIDAETIELYKSLENNTEIKNCELMTYYALIMKSDAELKTFAKQFDLIICDEAHRLGGPKTKIAVDKLFKYANKTTDFVGATATPTRMDNFDVSSHFYADRLVYSYTLYDAIEDGLIQKPNYCYATYDPRKDLENAFKDDHQDIHDADIEKIINAKMIEISKLYNMPNIIKDVCDKYAADTNYMKFIIFFASKQHMSDKLDDVVSWFQEAYPDHKIKTLRISSANSEESHNTDKLNLLTKQDKTIDLIACIDMLNLGYHVKDQTGILMYRGTQSNTIFTQQLGRALSAGTNNSAIVFDIVDNLHRKAVYELYVKNNKRSKKTADTKLVKPMLDNYFLDEITNTIMMNDANGNTFETQYHFDPETNTILDKNDNESTFVYDPETKTVVNTANANAIEKNINMITAECLNATGHEAKYEEIIAKVVAEPLTQRCKYALQLHFRSWCYSHHVPYPISDEELTRLYDLDITDFYEQFKKIIKKNKIKYPLHDATKLLKIGTEPNATDVPLAICCEDRGTSIEILTECIFNSRKKEDSDNSNA